MRIVRLYDCVSDYPLARQLTDQLEDLGFSWKKHQKSRLVDDISLRFRSAYTFEGEEETDGLSVDCGFCGHKGLMYSYTFTHPGFQRPVMSWFGGDEVKVLMPHMLTTGSECKEFPRVFEKIRDNYRQKVLYENGGIYREDKALASSVKVEKGTGLVYYPSKWFRFDEKFIRMLDSVSFVYLERAFLPDGCRYMYESHAKVKAYLGKNWMSGHPQQYINKIYYINNKVSEGHNFIIGVPAIAVANYQEDICSA